MTDTQDSARDRLSLLRLHFPQGVPLTSGAAEAKVAIRTLRYWLAAYRAGGPASGWALLLAGAGVKPLPDTVGLDAGSRPGLAKVPVFAG